MQFYGFVSYLWGIETVS